MKEIKLAPEKIALTLIQNLPDQNCVFIFSTDTVMNSWIEYLVVHPELSGTDAIPMERFIAWDNFKGKYLRAEENNKTTIPSILKKLFVQDLISKNASKPKDQRFQVIINPEDEYASTATSFTDWIYTNLPSLHFWKKRMDENKSTYGEPDLEDKDYLTLYEEYKSFLDKNNLYEPSWIEDLDLGDKNTRFILFYPELLEDYGDFAQIFSKCDNITIATMPEDIPNPPAYLYPDSRSELRQTMLRIIDLVNSGKADWSEIALSVPDLDTYRPYIEREFGVYEIPYVIKAGIGLTQNSAGKVFKEISTCYNENFTFDSIRALILDEYLPWKKENSELREELVRVGNELRCICSPNEKDIWLSALQSKINRVKNEPDKVKYYSELKEFYRDIKKHVSLFYKAETFEQVNDAWGYFKRNFLDESEFTSNANAILGRCISELKEISQIEKDYKDCGINFFSPFDFFLSEIDKKKYTPQQKNKTGVNIYSYKLSGPAYFKYQFVIDASQKNLDVPYKRLTFLNATKRTKLHLIEDDKKVQASEVFIKLYAKNSDREADFVTFSAAESTFAGFAIPHSTLSILKTTDSEGKELNYTPDLNSQDYIKNVHDYMLNPDLCSKPEKLTESQKQQFSQWCSTESTIDLEYHINKKIEENLHKILIENRNGNTIYDTQLNDNKIKITAQADLKNFFPCPRKWILSKVLKLQDDTLDTNLMQSYDMGNLNHKILELFFTQFEGKTLPYYDEDTQEFKIINTEPQEINAQGQSYEIDLYPFIEKALSSMDFCESPLVYNALNSQKPKIAETIRSFMKFLLLPYGLNPKTRNLNGIGNCRVAGCEKTLIHEEADYDYFGKIDCLLYTPAPENDWIIIDYKNSKGAMPNSSNTKVDENGILHDFQMPVYFTLLDREKKHKIAAGYFYAIKDKEKAKAVDVFSGTKPKDENGKSIPDADPVKDSTFQHFSETMKALERYSKVFAEKTKPESDNKDFTPYKSSSEKDIMNVNPYKDCINCHFKNICRTTYSIGGKSIQTSKGAN